MFARAEGAGFLGELLNLSNQPSNLPTDQWIQHPVRCAGAMRCAGVMPNISNQTFLLTRQAAHVPTNAPTRTSSHTQSMNRMSRAVPASRKAQRANAAFLRLSFVQPVQHLAATLPHWQLLRSRIHMRKIPWRAAVEKMAERIRDEHINQPPHATAAAPTKR